MMLKNTAVWKWSHDLWFTVLTHPFDSNNMTSVTTLSEVTS